MRFVGIDGCRAGWFYVGLATSGKHEFGIARDTAQLAALVARAALAFIDIPIGLKESGAFGRSCDTEARRVLGRPRSSSVFPAPVRRALGAPEEMSKVNHAATGKYLSRQALGICGKIRDIDHLLRARADLRAVFRESHPEVCFWSFNGRRGTVYNKKRIAGRRERIDILGKYLPHAEAIAAEAARAFRRKDVGWDDILDALVLALAAKLGCGRLRTLPANPERDAHGLPMEIVFADV